LHTLWSVLMVDVFVSEGEVGATAAVQVRQPAVKSTCHAHDSG